MDFKYLLKLNIVHKLPFKTVLVMTLFLAIGYITFAQPCQHLPKTFSSYNEAATKIKQSYYQLKEDLNCSDSSWILKATYYSCDVKSGYFLLTIKKGKEYIHQNMPIKVWQQFKNADSFGTYYNQHIKGRYQLKIE